MKEQIIACINDTKSTHSICQWAVWAATRLVAPIKLLHALEKTSGVASADLSGSLGIGGQEELLVELMKLDKQHDQEAQAQSEHLLNHATEIMASLQREKEALLTVSFCHQPSSLLDTLVELEAKTQLVIIGEKSNQSTVFQELLDDHLNSVIRALHSPVLIAKGEFKEPEKIMIAYDGSDTGWKMLEDLSIRPLLKGPACDLVMVGGEHHKLYKAQTMLHTSGIHVSTCSLSGEVESMLNKHITQHNIDLVIMGAYGHSRLRQFLLGSHTSRMLSQSPVSLLLLR